MDSEYDRSLTQAAIVRFCDIAKESKCSVVGGDQHGNLVVKMSDKVVIKFGLSVTSGEACALKFASQKVNPNIIKVPKIHKFFTRELDKLWTIGYLVMELVEGKGLDQLESEDCLRLTPRIKDALEHVQSIHGEVPGPLDGSKARGLLFSEEGCSQNFTCRQDLEDYLNQRLASTNDLVDISKAELCLCHLDIAPRNILLTPDNELYLVDWGCAGFYPSYFEAWAIEFEFHNSGHPLLRELSLIVRGRSPDNQINVRRLNSVYAANRTTAL